jgi:hypothetical protein
VKCQQEVHTKSLKDDIFIRIMLIREQTVVLFWSDNDTTSKKKLFCSTTSDSSVLSPDALLHFFSPFFP